MLQWPLRSLRVTSVPMPGRRKLSWSSVSSRVLTSNSSLMASLQYAKVVQLLLHRNGRRLVWAQGYAGFVAQVALRLLRV
jgi:hypothetical protein